MGAADDENLLEPSSAGSDAILETIRVARETNNLNNNQNNKINPDQETKASEKAQDQQAAPAENSSSAIDELTLDSIEDDENRGKRFVFMINGRNNCLINYESKQIFELRLLVGQWSERWRISRRIRQFPI